MSEPREPWSPPVEQTAPAAPVKAKPKRRIFRWVFLAINALFLVWIIVGANSGSSNKDCGTLTAQQCADAAHVGTGIGIALIVILWLVVDAILFMIWVVMHLSRRKS